MPQDKSGENSGPRRGGFTVGVHPEVHPERSTRAVRQRTRVHPLQSVGNNVRAPLTRSEPSRGAFQEGKSLVFSRS